MMSAILSPSLTLGSKMDRKNTMVEFVVELQKLLNFPNVDSHVRDGLRMMIMDAKAGEYHDYKNVKYACGKMAASHFLRQMGFIPLAMRVEHGEFDECADADDVEMLKRISSDLPQGARNSLGL